MVGPYNTNSSTCIGSVVVKGFLLKFVDMSALLMITQPTYIICNTGITVWLGLKYFSSKRVNLKLTFMSESDPVLLVP